jgi:tRNA dimethylallyltransferase
MSLHTNAPPLIVVVGETASGKSALALELAKQFDGELVCADSMTVYKDFDIGTAKPSQIERAQVPHHVLDVADGRGGFNAVVFKGIAQAAIGAIAHRGKLPILVGGTGLYVDSVIYNYDFPTAPPQELRNELNELSLDQLIRHAEELGLVTAGVDTQNKRRVVRLIENGGQLPAKQPLRPNTLVLGLVVPREELRERISKRVDAMLAAGLEYEAQKLSAQYGWEAEPMKAIGYREWQEYFAGTQTLDETRSKIIAATMGLAKKQRTWFRRNSSIQWVYERSKVVEIVTTFLNK